MTARALALLAACVAIGMAMAQPRSAARPELESFIANMVERHGMEASALHDLLGPLQPLPAIVKAVAAPSTSRPWREYRPLNVDQTRINAGVQFWNTNAEVLARARQVHGVPESIVTAILAVETRFGRITGNFRVLDALYTLGFEVPGRNEYFKSELENFLLLSRERGWDAASVKGSFAGAMGMPQFMPSSYRQYAQDFNDDGGIDLWTDTADVIGSVANFLRIFGWRAGEPVAVPASVEGSELESLLALGIRPHTPLADLRARGVRLHGEADDALPAALFLLDGELGAEYWIAFGNLNAILQYNRSRNYAMSVYLLAVEIARERERQTALEPSHPTAENPPGAEGTPAAR